MNKLFITALLLVAALPTHGQTAPSPVQSAADTTASPAQKVDPMKAQLIRQVLARNKEPEQARERILQAMEGMKARMPRVAQKFWDKYQELVSLDELRDRMVDAYDKYYTSEELSELLKFYDSPIGKKVSENALPISRDAMGIAQELSKRAAQSVAADSQAEQFLQMPGAGRSLNSPVLAPTNPAVSPVSSPTATPTAP